MPNCILEITRNPWCSLVFDVLDTKGSPPGEGLHNRIGIVR